ncbi:hypothetical protein CBR_g55301 [Chara braunii]|uniref:Uncharacterized protein n=1 Tax=Chara braunii TaxID=69332 RepID=A0A388MCV0_CHABU|nr:hypothetical protein CBR_g55301 [Chara braunii]|eukprot:GBG92394.1 hypothetical protein CBR_g55301 [Chara braunii]
MLRTRVITGDESIDELPKVPVARDSSRRGGEAEKRREAERSGEAVKGRESRRLRERVRQCVVFDFHVEEWKIKELGQGRSA